MIPPAPMVVASAAAPAPVVSMADVRKMRASKTLAATMVPPQPKRRP